MRVALAAIVLAMPAAADTKITFEWFFIPPDHLGFLEGVSADGKAFAGLTGTGDDVEAFLLRDDDLRLLGDLPGGTVFSWAFDLSADASTPVGIGTTDAGYEAMYWREETGMVGLGTLPHSDYSWAEGVSANGTVIVGHSGKAGEHSEPFRWTAEAGMVGLGFIEGYPPVAGAVGVSDDGNVAVGIAYRDSAGRTEAFRWTDETGSVGLGFLPDDDSSAAYGISGDGDVIVGLSGPTGEGRAVRWVDGKDINSLVEDDHWSDSLAIDASFQGDVIVGRGSLTRSAEAFMWTPDDGMVSLQSYLEENGVEFLEWEVLTVANATSADGRTVIGLGVTGPEFDTYDNGWIATVPIPLYGAPGDSNCDEEIDFDDIDCFVAALISEDNWRACVGKVHCRFPNVNDVNRDGSVDLEDIDGFVDCLVRGTCR
jgi:probable HAF family extracellular repeat protein